jgi:3-oxoacyl-[acyl-carrier-protein] synthase III
MAIFSVSNTKIVGISAAIPKNEVSNTELNGLDEKEIELLIQTTGIKHRRIAEQGVSASDLCLKAAEKLLDDLNWKKEEIELLLFVSQTPDYQIPGSSMLLQDKLGLSSSCMVLDLHQGCAGYVYGLSTITSIMSASKIKKGLLLVGDTITRLLRADDMSTVPIFSDAGSATALEFDPDAPDMLFNLQSNGSKNDVIKMEKGEHMKMRGHEIFTFGLKEVAANLEKLLEHGHLNKEEIDHFVFHQANKLLNESIRKKMNLPPEKCPMTLQKYGNTSCATIPLTIVSEIQQAIQQKNTKLILSGFGVGLSWGSAYVNFSDIQCPDLIEL